MQRRIPLTAIYGNPDQPRKTFDRGELEDLARSISENGLKQPITVRADDDGRFMIVMGERRFRAHELLADRTWTGWQTGFDTILCQVSKAEDRQLAVDAIIENDQRVDVSPLEQAHAYQRMIGHFGFTVESLAKKLGKQAHRIQERLDLLSLGETAMQLFSAGQISPERAWYLCRLDERKQGLLIKAIAAGQCNTTTALKAVFEALREEGSQSALFDMAPIASDEDRKVAAGFEASIERISGLLRGAIDSDQVVTAVRRVEPGRAGTVADLLAAMTIDIRRLETAFRVAAAGSAMIQE